MTSNVLVQMRDVFETQRPVFDLSRLFDEGSLSLVRHDSLMRSGAAIRHALVPVPSPRSAALPVLRGRVETRPSRLLPAQRVATRPEAAGSERVVVAERFGMQRVTGSYSNASGAGSFQPRESRGIPVHWGVGPFVSVATVKAFFDLPGETVLRRVGERWQPLGDDYLIDLLDRSQEFLIGAVQFYS